MNKRAIYKVTGVCFLMAAGFFLVKQLHSKESLTHYYFPTGVKLQTADLILREGRGVVSNVFKNCSQEEKKYSHAGFIVMKNNNPYVYHYIDDETTQGLKCEPLASFINTTQCKSYAVYRYAIATKELKALQYSVEQEAIRPVAFDNDFDLHDNSKMYCTEWVYKCYQENTSLIITKTTFDNYTFIAPDNLYIHSKCLPVVEYTYVQL